MGACGCGKTRAPEEQGFARGSIPAAGAWPARDSPPRAARRSADPALAHLVPRCCCAQSSRSGGSSRASASMASAGWALGRGRRRGPAGRGSSRSCLAGGRGGGGTRGREREGARRGREGGRSGEPGAAPPRAARHGPLPPSPSSSGRPACSSPPASATPPRPRPGVQHSPSQRRCPCRP